MITANLNSHLQYNNILFIFTQQYDSKINDDPSDFGFLTLTEPPNVKPAFNTCLKYHRIPVKYHYVPVGMVVLLWSEMVPSVFFRMLFGYKIVFLHSVCGS